MRTAYKSCTRMKKQLHHGQQTANQHVVCNARRGVLWLTVVKMFCRTYTTFTDCHNFFF